jgi:hypothetical protein
MVFLTKTSGCWDGKMEKHSEEDTVTGREGCVFSIDLIGLADLSGLRENNHRLPFGLRLPKSAAQGAFFVVYAWSSRHQTAANVRHESEPSTACSFGKSARGQ